ncbi:MAG: hypothetical protein MRJ93_04760 [Nitrososphaeraceae archaeon]|nr:hypothetical protein [Nitrososphaeraceae archaeon]
MNISRTIPIFLIATILVFGTTVSMGISTSFAQSYEDSYGKDQKTSNLNLQKVNCNNIIKNGVDSADEGTGGGDMIKDMTNEGDDGTGRWSGNGDKKESNSINENIVNFCKNKNNKVVIVAEEEPQPGSLTVKKEIFGCENMDEIGANCQPLQNNSPDWISCDNPTISNNVFCQELSEDLFDIEVLDKQNNQILQFVGSQQGTTIHNLEPGIYTVNEIKHQSNEDQLGESEPDQRECNTFQNFPEGGNLVKQNPMIDYSICFEYEDEQGEDCTTNAIAAGEAKTCIVKNYISEAIIMEFP